MPEDASALSKEQFADPNRAANLRVHGRYVLHDTGAHNLIHAYPASRNAEGQILHPTSREARKKPVASFTWFGGTPTEADLASNSTTAPGTIYKVIVKPAHQRKGIASAMLDFARERNPQSQIRHSAALSPEGKAWAEKKP